MKQKGKEWLNGVAEFLEIGQKLNKFRQKPRESLVKVNQTIEKIDAFGDHMREAVRHAANEFRIAADQPEKEYGEKNFYKYPLKQDTSEISPEEFAEQGMREGMAMMQRRKAR